MVVDLDAFRRLTIEEVEVYPLTYKPDICDRCDWFYARKLLRDEPSYSGFELYCSRSCKLSTPIIDPTNIQPISLQTKIDMNTAVLIAKHSELEIEIYLLFDSLNF